MNTNGRIESISTPSIGRTRLLVAVLVAVFVVPISVSGTAVALTNIAADLGSNPSGQQWALNGFNVTFAASTLTWGSLSDRIGRWKAFQIGMLVFIIASLASFLSTNFILLDIARILAGLGAGAVFSVGSALLSITFSGSDRTRVFSIMGAIAGSSLAFGPTLCGVLTQSLGWRYIFALQGTLLVISAVLMFTTRDVTRGEPKAQSGFDWPATVLFFSMNASLVSTLILGSTGNWARADVFALGGLFIACLAGLIAWESHATQPLLDPKVISHPHFLGVSLVVAVASFTFASLVTYAPSMLQTVAGFTPSASGLFVMFMTVPTLIAPLLAGYMASRGVATRTVLTIALALMVLGAAMVAFFAGSPVLVLAPFMVILGAGFGLHAGLVDNAGLAAAPDSDAGMAAGWINTIRVGSEAIAISLFGAIFIPALERPDTAISFRTIGVVSASVSLIIGIVSAVAMHYPKRNTAIE